MKLFIQSLPVGSQFAIIGFGSDYKFFSDTKVTLPKKGYGDLPLRIALEYLRAEDQKYQSDVQKLIDMGVSHLNMDQMIELCAKTNDPYEQINKARKMKKSSTTKVAYEERFIWDYNDESQ